MLVINSIEKTRLSADSYSYSGTGVAWKARLVLFLGFALMAGGLAGSVVSRGSSVRIIERIKGKRQRMTQMDSFVKSSGKSGRRRGLGASGSADISIFMIRNANWLIGSSSTQVHRT